MNMKRLLLYVGSALFFFVFWMLWVFPYDALKSRIITEIENRSQGRYRLEVNKMDISVFGSVTFRDLTVNERVEGQEQAILKTPKLKIGFSPFGLISQQVDFSFYLKGSKGDLTGKFRQEADETEVALDFSDFPISDLKFLTNKAKVGLRGILQGTLNLKLNKGDPSRNDGKIDLGFENLTMDATKISLDPNSPEASMDIPELKLSGPKGSGIKGDVKKEDLTFSSITLTGGDLNLDLDGKVSMVGASSNEYRLALQGGFKVSDSLAKALPILGFLDQQKNSEGVYPLNISGRLGKPQIKVGKFPLAI